MRVAVIGSGSWATALVKLLVENKNETIVLSWWLRSEENAAYIRLHGHNPKYLTSAQLPVDQINISTNLQLLIVEAELVILAIPSAYLHEQLATLPETIFQDKLVASAIKGVIPETYQVVGTYLKERFNVSEENILVIGGPCHAEEVAMEKLSFLTIASGSHHNALTLADLLSCPYLKTSISSDLYGVEYAAVLKNVYAIAAGICHGLGYGDNFQALLITYAIKEMELFMNAVSPMERNLMDSVYLGDLLVTAYSQFSRNRTFGMMVGKGYAIKFAQLEMNMVAEGYYASKSLHNLIKNLPLEMQILETVYAILYENAIPKNAIRKLIHALRTH
jgi:glycerol-3-phosphate dehydrogenase (NAD(P)+)